MEDPEFWRWVWLFTAVVFLMGEMLNPGSFFLLPFAIGAFVAALLAFLGVDVGWEWAAFVLISIVSALGLRPLAHRLDRDESVDGIGARRLIGQPGTVIEPIEGPADLGMVRINQEEWRALSVDDNPVGAGTAVTIVEVRGTRVVVRPA